MEMRRWSLWCLLLAGIMDYSNSVLTSHFQSSKLMIDLLQHMGGWNGSNPDVQPIPGSTTHSTALLLTGSARHLEVSGDIVQRVVHLLDDTAEFSILVAVKQQSLNTGTIFSIASNKYRYLELESSGRRDELRLHYYSPSEERVTTQTFPYRLADDRWHQIALTITHGQHVHLLLDCSFTYERPIPPLLARRTGGRGTSVEDRGSETTMGMPQQQQAEEESVSEDQKLHVWVGQRGGLTTGGGPTSFKGAIEYIKLVSSAQGYTEQCPYANVACPSCSRYYTTENSVHELYSMMENLNQKLQSAESRLTQLEQCECMQSCRVGDKAYRDGETWQRDHCTKCTCRGGAVECESPKCPTLRCKNPVRLDGRCCSVCLKSCYFNHNHYEHGEGFNPRPCRRCTCRDGKMTCERISPRSCPKLDCPLSQQVEGPECCPYCPGTDYCAAGNDCHVNATCINLDTKYLCQCKEGFVGLGQECIDRDECSLEGGRHGHHCNSNTRCVNTVGSYTCECIPGYIHVDPFTCREHNECDSGVHQCSPHAECINTEGSYVCRCAHGYRGDGYECQPVCESGCENGGTCEAPGRCLCRTGFTGRTCNIDIDECSKGLAACLPNSLCVNIPGSFYCKCKDGYHSNYPDNRHGALCKDVNECQGWGEGHRCPAGTVCHNTEGSFRCLCVDGVTGRSCEGSCQADGTLYEDGAVWRPRHDRCSLCTCLSGVVDCRPRPCDCSRPRDHDSACCPQCQQVQQCRHQVLPLLFNSGDTWTHDCQTCQCNSGEIDCWRMECPALSCGSTVTVEGDCCPRCLIDDPCAYDEIVSRLGKPKADMANVEEEDDSTCLYEGKVYTPKDEWTLEWDECTKCKCKRGHICCSYAHECPGGHGGTDRQSFMEQLDEMAAAAAGGRGGGGGKGKRGGHKNRGASSRRRSLLELVLGNYHVNIDNDPADDNPLLLDDHIIIDNSAEETDNTNTNNNNNDNNNNKSKNDNRSPRRLRANKKKRGERGGKESDGDTDRSMPLIVSRKERKRFFRQAARRRRKNLKSLELLAQVERHNLPAEVQVNDETNRRRDSSQVQTISQTGETGEQGGGDREEGKRIRTESDTPSPAPPPPPSSSLLTTLNPHLEVIDNSGYGFFYDDDSDMVGGRVVEEDMAEEEGNR